MKTVLVCDCIRDDGKPDPSCRSYSQCFAASEGIMKQLSEKMSEDMMSVLLGAGAFTAPHPTALRLSSSGGFEVVELRDDGSIIEPPKPCPKCGPFMMCAEHMALVT